jgi:archaellum component FlaC
MTETDRTARPEVEGLTVLDATDRLMEHDPTLDRKEVRGALYTVSAYGEEVEELLTWEAVESKLAHLSKVVSTPETRAELAEIALEDALEAAGEEREREVVQTRLDGHAARLDRIQREVTDLGADLRRLTEADEDLYTVAQGIVDLERRSNGLQKLADDLQLELEEFETWVSNPRSRFDELTGDLNALSESLEQVSDGLDRIERAVETGDTEPLETDDTALAWVDATFTHHVLELLLEDLRWEFDALRAWSDEDGDEVTDRVETVEDRLTEFERRVDDVGDRLSSVARQRWADRFADERAAFEADIEDVSPPIDWGAVQATLTEHRQGLQPETE